MASQQQTVDYLVEQMAGAGPILAKKMFGEYGLYCAGKMFGLVCDDQLFLKPTSAGRAFAVGLAEGSPYPGAKPCLLVPGDKWDDADWLVGLTRITVAALPAAAPKRGRSRGATP